MDKSQGKYAEVNVLTNRCFWRRFPYTVASCSQRLLGDTVATYVSFIICAYPGCHTLFVGNPGRQFCAPHELLIRKVATNQSNRAPVPVRPPTPPPAPPPRPLHAPKAPEPVAPSEQPQAEVPLSGPVRRGHRKLIEAQKRKFAKRARELDDPEDTT